MKSAVGQESYLFGYTYFSSKSNDGNFATMDFIEFKEFARAAEYREKEEVPKVRHYVTRLIRHHLTKTIAFGDWLQGRKGKNIVDLKGLFAEINEEEQISNNTW